MHATPSTPAMQPQPFATWNPALGCWETSQPDLFAHLAPYSEIWPTSGSMRDGSAYPLPWSAHHTTASASSSSRTGQGLFRTPLASDSTRGGETIDQVRARRGTIALSHEIIDLALHGPHGSPNKNNVSETLWSLIESIFNDGDATPTPSPVGSTSPVEARPYPRSLPKVRDHARRSSSSNGTALKAMSLSQQAEFQC